MLLRCYDQLFGLHTEEERIYSTRTNHFPGISCHGLLRSRLIGYPFSQIWLSKISAPIKNHETKVISRKPSLLKMTICTAVTMRSGDRFDQFRNVGSAYAQTRKIKWRSAHLYPGYQRQLACKIRPAKGRRNECEVRSERSERRAERE